MLTEFMEQLISVKVEELEMQYGLIGERLPHSFSKTIHESLGEYEYELREIAREDIDSFMRGRNFRAINVTIPYKQTVIPYLDEMSSRARSIGAVNTIVNHNGRLFGDNTDFGGMEALIRKMGLNLTGKKVIILGTGGTSRTAKAVAEELGASEIYRVSRSKKDGALSYDGMYERHSDAHIIINTTPCGMFPNAGECAADLDKFKNLDGVVDAVYNPLRTRFVLGAKERHINASGGLYMLVAQAVLASEIFLDRRLNENLIDETYEKLYRQKLNIVLIGLPSCGKTTAGKRLSGLTGRELFDSDEEIVRRTGVSISEIFAKRGEKAFRDMESELIAEASQRNGIIIATGGGAPLRTENVRALKSNGLVFFLDRDPDTLIPTSDRPLFDEKGKMKKLYESRYAIYTAAADIHVKAEGDYESVGDRVLELARTAHII